MTRHNKHGGIFYDAIVKEAFVWHGFQRDFFQVIWVAAMGFREEHPDFSGSVAKLGWKGVEKDLQTHVLTH